MIAKIHKCILSDKSEVFDVLIEESGVTMASIACCTRENADALLDAIDANSDVIVKRDS